MYQWIFVELFIIAFSFVSTFQEQNIEKICWMCHLKGFFILNIDLTECPFYVLYHWTFNGNIFAIKYRKWGTGQIDDLKNRISRKHKTSTFFYNQCIAVWSLILMRSSLLGVWTRFQTTRGEELVKRICLIVFQCNWDDCICVLLLFLRINIY